MKRIPAKTALIAGFVLLFAAYTADFYLDVRHRDAFTWMDPYQYFSFAYELHVGAKHFNEFELPSIFPFFISPILWFKTSIPSAFFVNIVFLLPFLLAIHRLCRHLEIGWPSPLVAACVLSCPLLIGLSRSLYVEFTLSAMVALQFVLWFESKTFTRGLSTVFFVVMLCLGFMTKMTYPVYFVGPFIVEAIFLMKDRAILKTIRLALVFLIPVALVLAIQSTVFHKSFTYYLTLGNTQVPIGRLIGPVGILSPESLGYYFAHIWKSMVVLLVPLMLLPIWLCFKDRSFATDRNILLLWAWFLTPMVLFSLPSVKEPRHVAPCVLPAVLLVFAAIRRVPFRAAARALSCLAVALAIIQYGAVTGHRRLAPYFLDRPSMINEILDVMIKQDPQAHLYRDAAGELDALRWRYTKNIAISGFDPNMALLLAWRLNPAVTYDLDLLQHPPPSHSNTAYESFEDLYFLNAFNLYNRRCLWDRFYETLDRATVVAHADYILARNIDPAKLERRYPRHDRMLTIRSEQDTVHVFRAVTPSTASYRSFYARRYMERSHPTDEEYAAIYHDLRMDAALRADFARAEALEKEFATKLNTAVQKKNIYWTARYSVLQQSADAILQNHANE